MEEFNIFPWLQQSQPPDGDTGLFSGVGDAGGTSDYDLQMGCVTEAPFEVEKLLQEAGMEDSAVCCDQGLDFDIPDSIVCRVDEMLQALFPGQPLSPSKLEQPQGRPHPPVVPNSAGLNFAGLENSVLGDGPLGIFTSGVENEAEVAVSSPPSRGKTGSRAFNYIGEAAVLETHGIPAPCHRIPVTSGCDGTDSLKPCGTRLTDPKLITVPDEVTSIITHPSRPFGTQLTDPKVITVPDKTTNIITHPSRPFGTQLTDPKLITVPDEVTSIISHPSRPCGTQLTDLKLTTVPEKTISIVTYAPKPCSTQPDPKLTTVPDDAASTPATETSSIPKRRRRRRKQVGGEARKEKLYERKPLSDVREERRRKDAVRAKNSRLRKSMEAKNQQERLTEMRMENDRLRQEVEGRRVYEKALLAVLRERFGIAVTPYSMARDQQMAPVQDKTSG